MAQVEAGLAGAGDAEGAVGVGLIVGAQSAGPMDEIDEFGDALVVDAGVFRVGDQQPGGARRDGAPERFEVGRAVGAGRERDHFVAERGGRAGVGGVGEDGGDDLVALRSLAARLVPGADHGDVSVDGLAAAGGRQAEGVHAGDGFEVFARVVNDFQDPLQRVLVLAGMKLRELRRTHELFVNLGVVLHRAGAKADVGVQIGADGLLREAQIVPQQLHLRDLGQPRRTFALQRLRD